MRESVSVESPHAHAARSLAPRQAVRFRATGFAPAPRGTTSWLVFAIVLAAWQAAGSLGLVSALFLPSPLAIVRALWRLAASGELWAHVSVSLLRIGAGWIIGTAVGVSVGLAVGLFSLARAAGLPIVSALFPIPKIALLPLLILWLGIGETSKIATIALGVFFPTVIAVYSGVDQVPNNLIRMTQSFELPFLAIVRKVVLPGALPNIVAGFRISTAIALLLVVSAEMIGAEAGIGAFVLQAGNLMQTDQLMAGVVVLSILGLAVARGIGALEARVTRWR
jgi:ABC-type nitrate/sulfonate/bicarbonate transport system permease component